MREALMTRRTIGFLVTLALGLLAVPLAAAPPPAALPRIGYLGEMPGRFADAFRQGLRERGYVGGQTSAIEYRWAGGQRDRRQCPRARQARATVGTAQGSRARHLAGRRPVA